MPFGVWAKDKKYKKAGRFSAESGKTAFEAYGLAAVWNTRRFQIRYRSNQVY